MTMESAYAQALWKMVEGGMSPAKAVHELRDLLKARGREALLPRIGRAFARIAEREGKRTGVTLSVAREKDERAAKSAVKQILAEFGVEPKEVRIRPMRHKWASCSSKGRLTFDTALLRQYAQFRAEVIVHELLHLKVPNHGKLFKALYRALFSQEQ